MYVPVTLLFVYFLVPCFNYNYNMTTNNFKHPITIETSNFSQGPLSITC